MFGATRSCWKSIPSRANPLKNTSLRQSGQCASVNALMSYVLGPQDGLLLRKAEKLTFGSPATLRRFAYTH